MQETCLGPYRLCERLGEGGMGTVWRATVEGRGGSVALKRIHPHLHRERGFRARFEREAEMGRRVDHPNVVRTLGAEILDHEGTEAAVLVMEYVEGRTLRSLLSELGFVPETLLRELARQIAAGLRSIHDAGIIHRDLKPENVLITRDDQVRIMDLGVARPVRASSPLTREGHFAGSLLYAAPEQLRGREADVRYDQYSLGILLYELATGRHPFHADTPAEIVGAHLHASPRRLVDTQPDVSVFFSALVATLMDKAPEGRFASAAELEEALRDAEGGSWWAARSRQDERELGRLRIPVTRDSAVFGRARELAMLRGAWEAARRGAGRTVLVEGEAGVGKTRLVDAFVDEIERQGVHALYASHPPEGTRNGLNRAVLDHLGDADLDARLAPWFQGAEALAQAFASVLRGEVSAGGEAPLSGDPLSAALVRLARGLAAERPVIWIVEDLHNANAEARRRVLSMARSLGDAPCLLVLTTRPGALAQELPELSRLDGFHRLVVPRLDPEALRRLTEALFVDPVEAERVGPLLAGRSDGVPFFLFELLRGLGETGRLRRRGDGRYEVLEPFTEIEAPSSVRDLVRLRLAELSADERHLIDAAAVEGYAFDPDLQARVLQTPRVRVLQTLAHLERRGGLVRSKGAGYQFDHHLVQEVVLGDLPLPLRQEYHALLAQALADREGVDLSANGRGIPDEIAHDLFVHLLDGNRPHGALPFVTGAAQHLALHAGEQAARALMRRALESLPEMPSDVRMGLLLQYASSLHAAGRVEEEREALDEAAALAERIDDERQRARVEMARGRMLLHVSAPDEAVEALETAIARSERGGFDEVTALAHQHLGFVYARTGRHEAALAECGKGIAAARRAGDPCRESALLGQEAASLWALRREVEAEAKAGEALALAREVGDHSVEARVLAQMATLCMRAGRHEAAVDAFLRFLSIVEEHGHRARISFACGNLGRIHENTGHLEEAGRRYEQAIRAARDLGDRRTEAMYRGMLGNVRRVLGDVEGAEASVEHSLRILRDVEDHVLEACGLDVLASVAAARDGVKEAAALLERALALFDVHAFPSGRARALRQLGMLRIRLGDDAGARSLLQRAREEAQGARVPQEALPAAAALAVLGDADPQEVLAGLREHESVLATSTRMRVLFDLFRATQDTGLLAEARSLLEELVQGAPVPWRERVRTSVSLHRDLSDAWSQAQQPSSASRKSSP